MAGSRLRRRATDGAVTNGAVMIEIGVPITVRTGARCTVHPVDAPMTTVTTSTVRTPSVSATIVGAFVAEKAVAEKAVAEKTDMLGNGLTHHLPKRDRFQQIV